MMPLMRTSYSARGIMLQKNTFFRLSSSYVSLKNPKIMLSPYSNPMMSPENYPNHLSLPEFVMSSFLDHSRKNKIAFLDGVSGDKLTYQTLYDSIYSCASYLRGAGIDKGSCVAIVSPNHLHYCTIFQGIALTGGHSTTVNPHYTIDEMAYQLELTKPKIIISHSTLLEKVHSASKSLSNVQIISIDESLNSLSSHNIIDLINIPSHKIDHKSFKVDQNSTITIPFSSGTTGRSKGVVLTHKNLIYNCLQLDLFVGQNETSLIPLPVFHIFGLLTGLCLSPRIGTKVILTPSFDLQKFLEIIQNERVTESFIVPPIALALAKHPMVSQYDLSSLKRLVSGAAPLGIDIQKSCAERLKCILAQAWGMTEISPAGTASTDTDVLPGSSGRLVPGSEAKIVHPLTREELDPTEEGEILFRGPQLMSGYYLNEEATNASIDSDGFLSTGDIGKFNKEGYLFITDRSKELIKYKGLQVPPAELEAIIASIPDVIDVVVIPVLDEEAGEIPRAYVVKRPQSDISEASIVEYVHAKVSPHKRLRGGVIFTDKIPKSPSGKLLRRVQIEIDRNMSKK
eukprot:gene4676-9269_t